MSSVGLSILIFNRFTTGSEKNNSYYWKEVGVSLQNRILENSIIQVFQKKIIWV